MQLWISKSNNQTHSRKTNSFSARQEISIPYTKPKNFTTFTKIYHTSIAYPHIVFVQSPC